MCISTRINNVVKSAKSANSCTRVMEFGSLDGRVGGEHKGVGFDEIPELFEMQDSFVFGTEAFDRVYIAASVPAFQLYINIFDLMVAS